MQDKPAAIIPQDIVLIHIENKPAFFARVEDINPDIKRGWWQVKMFLLALPMKVVTWIIDEDQIRGGEFTMGGTPVRIEKVEPPAEKTAEEPASEPDKEPEAATTDRNASGGKQARILSLGKKKDDD